MSTAVIGAPEFRARSGRTVRSNEDGSVTFEGVRGYIAPEQVFDAQEFFQAQRDLDYGRWRCPTEPDVVVYRDREDQALIRVIDELTGELMQYRREFMAHQTEAQSQRHLHAARAYFEAHPERKPWHDATPGEFWSVQHMGMCETCRVDDLNGVLRFVGVDGGATHVTMPITHHSITDALPMRIEVGS